MRKHQTPAHSFGELMVIQCLHVLRWEDEGSHPVATDRFSHDAAILMLNAAKTLGVDVPGVWDDFEKALKKGPHDASNGSTAPGDP